MLSRFLVAAIVLSSAFSTAAHAQFTSTSIGPSSGRVGYHLDVGVQFYRSDPPRGNSGGAVSGTCSAEWDHSSYSGTLPPGVQFLGNEVGTYNIFSGTPRQP